MQLLETRLFKAVSAAAIVAALSVGGAFAEPAEFPPASYKGTQYVDSKGCVYVRAGYGGVTQWVPRVTRSRKVICGFKPTAVAGAQLPVIADAPAATVSQPAPAAPAPRVAAVVPAAPVAVPVPAPAPVAVPMRKTTVVLPTANPVVAVPKQLPTPIAVNVPKPTAVVRAPTTSVANCDASGNKRGVRCGPQAVHPTDYILKRLPAGVTVRTTNGTMTTTQPTVVRVPVKTQVAKVAPSYQAPPRAVAQPVYAAPPVQARVQAPVQAGGVNCGGLSGNAAQFMQANSRYTVRCGPQGSHPSDFVIKQHNRAVVAHAQAGQIQARAAAQGYSVPRPVEVKVPQGYKPTWEDGRLNPNRGPQTYQGDLQQQQVWTNELPARSIYAPKKPWSIEQLFYPTATQVTRPNPGAVVQGGGGLTYLSSKSIAPSQTPTATQVKPVASGLKYVQVGVFGNPANVSASMSRLSALGLPVSTQSSRGKGASTKIVLAGPFASSAQTMQALGSVRAAGFSDAFARK